MKSKTKELRPLEALLSKLQETNQTLSEKEKALSTASKELELKVQGERAAVELASKALKQAQDELLRHRELAFAQALTPELIDILAPQHHGRRTCNDQNSQEFAYFDGQTVCVRCALLKARLDQWIDFSWSLIISPKD